MTGVQTCALPISGDLIFFKNTYNSGKIYGVSHVGICTGGTKFVDCGSSGVGEHDYTTYMKNNFLMIRRHNACFDSNDSTYSYHLIERSGHPRLYQVVSVFRLLGENFQFS